VVVLLDIWDDKRANGGRVRGGAAEFRVTPAVMAFQDMDRFSSFVQSHYPRKSAEHDLDRSLAPMKVSGSHEELARLLVVDRLTGMESKRSMSSNSLLGDRLGVGNKPKGKFDAQSGKWYRSLTLSPKVVESVGIKELMEVLNDPAIKFGSQSQTGVVFNILPSEHGMQLSLMCIGETHVEVDRQMQTAMARVKELLSETHNRLQARTLAGLSLFSRGDAATQLGDVQDTCAGITLFGTPADQQKPGDVVIEDNACGMSLFSHAPAAKDRKPRKGLAKPAAPCEFAVKDSCAGMTMFERPEDWKAPEDIFATESQAGMTMFASAAGQQHPPAEDVMLDSMCGMGMFSWKFEGMDEVEISKALSQASTEGSCFGSFAGSQPHLTAVGSMSSVVSALNDDDMFEFMEGFAGFTFFNRTRAPKDAAPEDDLFALESTAGSCFPAHSPLRARARRRAHFIFVLSLITSYLHNTHTGMTMFARRNSIKNMQHEDVSAETCGGMTMFAFEDDSQ
jgi:hypothetical protein